MNSFPKPQEVRVLRASAVTIAVCCLLLATGRTYAATGASVLISAEMGTSIASDLFPVTVKLSQGNLFLTKPALKFLDQRRIGMQVKFQAYNHQPELGIAVSETGVALLSGALAYDPVNRQILLQDPRIDNIRFDRSNEDTRRFLTAMQTAWTAQVTNPIRSALPPHPYLLPIRNNIQDISYDGNNIALMLSYE